MAQREQDRRGYVLHRRNQGDTSQIIDLFTETSGRVRVIAKGVRGKSGRSARFSSLDFFTPLTLGWAGRSDLKTLIQADPERALALVGDSLLCGLYVNELIWYLLQTTEPNVALFHVYEQVLRQLQAATPETEPLVYERVLRRFELALLDELGYGPDLTADAQGDPLDEQTQYYYQFEYGWVVADARTPLSAQLSGVQLKLLNEPQDWSSIDRASLRAWRKITQTSLDALLNGRPLNSRKLMLQQKQLLQRRVARAEHTP